MNYYLIYISQATKRYTQEQLLPLLAQSNAFNKQQNISGMLLYSEHRFLNKMEGRFMQLLEGNQDDIAALFNKIKLDDRHKNILLLTEQSASQRLFAEWSMGWKYVSGARFDIVNESPGITATLLNMETPHHDLRYKYLNSFFSM